MLKQTKLLFFIFSIFLINIFAEEQMYGTNPNLPTIVIITTGGTIAEKTDPKTNASIPAKGTDFVKSVPKLLDIANVKVIEFANIDSSQMTPQIWSKLSKTVDNALKDRKIMGAIITHGTDTMAEGSYFLDLTLKTDKPVVFTGAMRNASSPFSDGPFNLLNAVYQVISKDAKNFGVTVTLNSYINSSRDVVKKNTTNPQTFTSGEKGYLGYIFEGNVYRINDRLYIQKFPIPKKLPKIYIFQDFAGAGPEIIRYMADIGADAIVIESLGAGNVNAAVFEGIEYALKKGIIIINTSVVAHGFVFPIYGDKGGGETLKKAGVIFSRFLRADKARLLAMLAIPYVNGDLSKLQEVFDLP
ncbi:MAG: putative L-asparaginase [Candidatus Anoxychlamydiales bacterium]|nr:putative L-asparaginase [Candidatus Anoxychlamydiales bacterium]